MRKRKAGLVLSISALLLAVALAFAPAQRAEDPNDLRFTAELRDVILENRRLAAELDQRVDKLETRMADLEKSQSPQSIQIAVMDTKLTALLWVFSVIFIAVAGRIIIDIARVVAASNAASATANARKSPLE